MTWGEFKEWVEKYGVEDGDRIDYMDFEVHAEIVERTEQDGAFFVSVQ